MEFNLIKKMIIFILFNCVTLKETYKWLTIVQNPNTITEVKFIVYFRGDLTQKITLVIRLWSDTTYKDGGQ